jgi:hypothetical protein
VSSARPAPTPSRDSAFFWDRVQRGQLVGQRCAGCSKLRHPPRPMCPHCRSFEWEELSLSGRGTVHSFIAPVHPPLPMFEPGYLVALIDLDEGIRLLSNLCDVRPEDVQIGMAVEVFFVETAEDGRVHQFRPADG